MLFYNIVIQITGSLLNFIALFNSKIKLLLKVENCFSHFRTENKASDKQFGSMLPH
jgi:3-deoxy-D-manno-octulosonic-acid transferase